MRVLWSKECVVVPELLHGHLATHTAKQASGRIQILHVPRGPRAQIIRFEVPKAIQTIVFGSEIAAFGHLDP